MKNLKPARYLPNYGLGVHPDYKTNCPDCQKALAQILFNNDPMVKTNQVFSCAKCLTSVKTKEYKGYEKQAHSLFQHQNTGEEKVLDQRGNEMESPYGNRDIDQHGWLKTHTKEYKKYFEDLSLLFED